MEVFEGDKEVSLSVGEHKALVEYLSIITHMENMERQQIYFRGHTDSFAYLKRVGAI